VRMALAALGVAVLPGCGPAPTHAPAATASAGPASLTVVATGDVLIHQDGHLVAGAAAAGRAHGVDYDFSGVFAPVAPIISTADLAICHLETPLAPPGGPFEGYPTFDVQPQIAAALAGAGYDDCSTASNHSMDAGFPGLVRTLDILDAAGVGHTGTFRTARQAQTPHLLDIGGVKLAHLSW